ncbi:hypothetical protein NDU88_003317 [Pleurodeles waltl]|uniref:Uncharacterized protein n=1 Tax=Pleurodeles waltl TaxID=8319 RepID=A0AAV7LIH6_PLEWA|nr:hypothetical protein NDU88_003317 [Pleurodeles waltl]
MPGGRTSGKQSGKPSRQLLFSEALQNLRAPPPTSELQALTPPGIMTEPAQGATMDRIEGADIHSYLRETLPKLTGLTFDPPLEFQRVHRLGPKRRDNANHPLPIIPCLLRHVQTRQLL